MGPLRLAHPTICSFGIEYFGATANEQGIRIFEPSDDLAATFAHPIKLKAGTGLEAIAEAMQKMRFG